MSVEKILKNLTLKEKIAQMLIMGFHGTDVTPNISRAISSGLGGVIFFAHNISSMDQFRNLVKALQKKTNIPLFTSIDQEGGLVERTISIDNRIEYLSPMGLTATGSLDDVRKHTEIMAQELSYYGINMNFAPVLDVNTNPKNPIIGVRSFGKSVQDVIDYSKPVYETLMNHRIVPVGKHFPGHGEAWIDSHLDLPRIDLSMDELESLHIKPFKEAIKNGLEAIMVAHVHYPVFNKENRPASLSKEVVTGYLKGKLGYDGLIISDDMDMGGIINHYSKPEACIEAIKAGIDLLIVRDSKDEDLKIIDDIETAVKNGVIPIERIDESALKILSLKQKYCILEKQDIETKFSQERVTKNNAIIADIADKSVKVIKKGTLLPFDCSKKTLLLVPNRKEIFNYSKDRFNFVDHIEFRGMKELTYSLDPEDDEISQIMSETGNRDVIIFLNYNIAFNAGQQKLLGLIDKPLILVSCGIPYSNIPLNKVDTVINTYSLRPVVLKSLIRVIFES